MYPTIIIFIGCWCWPSGDDAAMLGPLACFSLYFLNLKNKFMLTWKKYFFSFHNRNPSLPGDRGVMPKLLARVKLAHTTNRFLVQVHVPVDQSDFNVGWLHAIFPKKKVYVYKSHVDGVTSRDGLVGYDAALTQLRSGVRFPLFVRLLNFAFLRLLWAPHCP